MKLNAFQLLTDENIDAEVTARLRNYQFDVVDVEEEGWSGISDLEVLRRAVFLNRVLVTHDKDFGTLAVFHRVPMIGIINLKPGHIDAAFTNETIDAMMADDPDVDVPFLLIAKRTANRFTFRIRSLT